MKTFIILIYLIPSICFSNVICRFEKRNGNTAYHPFNAIQAIVKDKNSKLYRVKVDLVQVKGFLIPNIFFAKRIWCQSANGFGVH